MRQPPMLHVAFDELPRSSTQQVLARHRRLRRGQRHAVLQLVAKTVGAACLIECRTGPDAAGQRLVQQPAVQHDIHRTIRRLHLDGAEDTVPVAADLRQHLVEISLAVPRDKRAGILRACCFAEEEDDLDAGIWRQHDRIFAARRTDRDRRLPLLESWRRAGERCWTFQCAIAADELSPITRPVGLAPRKIGEGNARSEGGMPWIAREHRAGVGIDRGRHERCGGAARRTQYPFDVGGQRKVPRTARRVAGASAARALSDRRPERTAAVRRRCHGPHARSGCSPSRVGQHRWRCCRGSAVPSDTIGRPSRRRGDRTPRLDGR